MQIGEDRFNKEEINRLYDKMIILSTPQGDFKKGLKTGHCH
jgi:hypothetical protein